MQLKPEQLPVGSIVEYKENKYDEKKDFTCGCLYTCNTCLEADNLGVSRHDYYNDKNKEDYDY